MADTVNITDLSRAAEKYDRDFKVLPFVALMGAMSELGLRMVKVNYKDTIIEQQRKGGITKPYEAGTTDPSSEMEGEIMQLKERSLIVEPGYCAIKDNIQNYREKQVLFDPTKDTVNHKTKKHPLEKEIVGNKIKTVAEDIIDAIFHGERDITDKSPSGLMHGYDYKIDQAVASGELAAANGNYIDSGSLAAPANDTDTTAIDNLVTWLRKRAIRFGRNPVLRMPIDIYHNCADALEIKLKYKADINADVLLAYLRDKAKLSNLKLIAHDALGTGDRIHLSENGIFDFGMNTPGDQNFVQVRSPYEDPNLVQFWLQFEAGTRINSFHEKMFMCNQGSPTANELSGDYLS
ncbi:MAG: hypothetical protein ACQER7_06260 [Bacteroidota bacterium]